MLVDQITTRLIFYFIDAREITVNVGISGIWNLNLEDDEISLNTFTRREPWLILQGLFVWWPKNSINLFIYLFLFGLINKIQEKDG